MNKLEEAQKPIVIIGAGGHGRVVFSALRAIGRSVVAATDLNPSQSNPMDIEVITDDELCSRFSADEIQLVLGLGSIWPTNDRSHRRETVAKFLGQGYQFTGLAHPRSFRANESVISVTTQIHAGAVVQTGATVGDFSILNTRCSVDHDCTIEDFCHIGPGVTISGGVKIGSGCHIGTGANIIQGIRLGRTCFVAAGATVTSDVADGQYVKGTPARSFQPKQNH